MMEEHIVTLIVRRWSGEITPEEAAELESWAGEKPENLQLADLVADEAQLEKELALWKKIDPEKGYQRWLAGRRRRRAQIARITAWTVAASLLIAVAIVGIIRNTKGSRAEPDSAVTHLPVMPGRNTATLILTDGRKILLDSVGTGPLTVQGNTQVTKADSGSVAYQASEDVSKEALSYNVLVTPRAGQYELVLPDGSKVWLNNLSSLRYPTRFVGADRTVELKGEAYFEIAKDATKPFFVKLRDATVEVLGTSFNVMSYDDEGGTQTTLLNGIVQVRAGKIVRKLGVDEQARVDADQNIEVVHDVPSGDIVSWKNGFFYFGKTASFSSVMRQLARWYDVDIVYEGKVPDIEFGGKIDRTVPLNDLLKYLDKNQVRFRLDGRKLIVLPN